MKKRKLFKVGNRLLYTGYNNHDDTYIYDDTYLRVGYEVLASKGDSVTLRRLFVECNLIGYELLEAHNKIPALPITFSKMLLLNDPIGTWEILPDNYELLYTRS